jgi:hypothetical protein
LDLPHALLLTVASAFRRGDIPEQPSSRQKTPPPNPNTSLDPPDSSTNIWMVDADDAQRSPAIPPLTSRLTHPPFFTRPDEPYVEFDFILRPEVKENLKMYRTVFKIGVGWRTGYEGHHCVTNVPDPLQSVSGGSVPSSHLAVSLTAKTKGARTLQENIHEKFLTPFSPSKKGTLCMVIKEAEDRRDGERDGERNEESVGTILSVAVSSKKN